MKRIRFSISYPDRFVHPLHREIVQESPVSRAELLVWSPTEDPTTLFWFDAGRAAAERVVGSIDSLLGSHLVADGDGTYAFLRQDAYEFPDPLLDTIAGSRVVFLPPVVFRETGEIGFEAVGEAEALSTFHGELSELGTLTIERVQEFERSRSPSGLTDRQRAALDAAVAVGYYDVPREGSIADIADALDCSPSTAGELVRKAEATVIRAHVRQGE